MVTNRPGYMKQYRAERRMLALFLATDGEMTSAVSGEPLVLTNDREKTGNMVVFHHKLELNGNRKKGSLERLKEIIDNSWNIDAVTHEEHLEIHRSRGNLGGRRYT